jgi:hypothetical protein
MEEIKNSELYSALRGNFELKKADSISLDEIKKQVESVIRELLDKNLEKLMSILYIIDVSQKTTDEIFKIESKDDIVPLLADAVIKRQLQKLQTRMKYKNERQHRNEGKLE